MEAAAGFMFVCFSKIAPQDQMQPSEDPEGRAEELTNGRTGQRASAGPRGHFMGAVVLPSRGHSRVPFSLFVRGVTQTYAHA